MAAADSRELGMQFMVMVRPLSGAMGAQFERIQQEALELADQFTRA